MRKYLFSALLGLIILVIAACGGDDKAAAPAAVATTAPAAPAATSAPAAKAPAAKAPATSAISLADAAAKHAGGPGAFYIGDLSQLVGAAPAEGLGDADDMVNLAGLERERYLFDSVYYRALVEKANFTNPTEMVYDGKPIDMQFTCINRTIATCKLVEAVIIKNVKARTQGKINLVVSSFPELGLAGPDTLDLVAEGTLAFAEIYAGYVAGDLPQAEITFLYGLYPNHEIEFQVNQAVQGDLEKLFVERTGGGHVIGRMWVSGGDQFFFCRDPIRSLADFKGKKTRSHGAALSDWIEGMGAEAQFVAFAEVYTALERGILDCGVTVAFAAMGQRWYEVTDYMVGPLPSQLITNMIMNKDVFDKLPPDLQQIMVEEGARHELEAMRVTPAWNEVWIQRNIDAGLEYIEFTPEMKAQEQNVAVMKHVLPAWINRVGGADSDIVKLFNEKIAPIVGMKINPDGSTSPLGEKFVSASAKLQAYADAHAGGPGAIYVGDINQLVGPTSDPGQGDLEGMVPLDALQRQTYIYESDYYKGLIEKANLTNPTELVSTDANIEIQHACINRALGPCQSIIHYFAPQLEARTGGALKIMVSSFPELGLAGPDTLALVSDGTIAMANIYGGYVGGALPPIEIQVLWGVYPDQKSEFLATAAITPDLENLVTEATGGGILINHNWFSGNDQYFFTMKPLNTLEDFKGLKTRSHGAALSDWIEGMGAQAQFVAFAEVYTALERGILGAGVTGADAAFGQRWYEVTDYINGPLISFPSTNNVINGKVWDKIPADLQQIMIEEGAKSELEALRIASIQNEMGLLNNTLAGLEFVEFSDELKKHSFEVAVMQHVIPAWVRKVGGTDAPMVKVFNEKVSPIVGLYIEDDGSVTITKAR